MIRISADIMEAGKATGWVTENGRYADGQELPLSARREGRTWYVYVGTSDEYRGHGSSLLIALKRLAKALDITSGVIRIGDDRTDVVKGYDVVTGKPAEIPAPTVTDVPQATEETEDLPLIDLPFEPGYFPNQDGGTDIRTGNGDLVGWTRERNGRYVATTPNGGDIADVATNERAIFEILREHGTVIEPVTETPNYAVARLTPRSDTAADVARRELIAERARELNSKPRVCKCCNESFTSDDITSPEYCDRCTWECDHACGQDTSATEETPSAIEWRYLSAEIVRVLSVDPVTQTARVKADHRDDTWEVSVWEIQPLAYAESQESADGNQYNVFVDAPGGLNVARLSVAGTNVAGIANFLTEHGFNVSYDMWRDVPAPQVTPGHVMSVTVISDSTVTGGVAIPGETDAWPISGRELDGFWYLYAGTDGEYSANAPTFMSAVLALASRMGVKGNILATVAGSWETILSVADATPGTLLRDAFGLNFTPVLEIDSDGTLIVWDDSGSQVGWTWLTEGGHHVAATPMNNGLGTSFRLPEKALESILSEYGTPVDRIRTAAGLRDVTPLMAASRAIRSAGTRSIMTDAEAVASENFVGHDAEDSAIDHAGEWSHVTEIVTVFVDEKITNGDGSVTTRAVTTLDIAHGNVPAVAEMLRSHGYDVAYDVY